MISANDFDSIQFSDSENGYNKAEVDAAMSAAKETIAHYSSTNEDLYKKMEVLAQTVEKYRADTDSISAAILTAQKTADRVRQESQEQADALLSESKKTADKTETEAREKADKIIADANNYSATHAQETNEKADAIIAEAQKKANDAINSSKIVAQNILDQAEKTSKELLLKSKEEKEAYELLIESLKSDANQFIASVKALYSAQLDNLNNANIEVTQEETQIQTETVANIGEDIDNLVEEIKDIEESIPTDFNYESIDKDEVEEAPSTVTESENISSSTEEDKTDVFSIDEEPQVTDEYEDVSSNTEEDNVEVFSLDEEPAEEVPTEFEDVYSSSEDSEKEFDLDTDTDVDEIVETTEETIPQDEEVEAVEETADEEDEIVDINEAIKGFTGDELKPIDKTAPYVSVIDEDVELTSEEDKEEASLFDEKISKLPFESYFNIKREDPEDDRSETISLVPPEEDGSDEDDDDDNKPKFRGFFNRNK